jgi:hypothetical protein
MDPSWTECQYCIQSTLSGSPAPQHGDNRRRTVELEPVPQRVAVRNPTQLENMPLPPRHAAGPPPVPGQQAQAPVEQSRNPTRFAKSGQPSGEGSGPAIPAATKNRRVVGVLVTYSWVPEGQVFKVLEGRNVIGRGKCEISVPEDETMSMENSSIAFRETFMLKDRDSMSGTYLNGKAVEEQARLSNYAQIRAGSTVFTFVALDPGGI